MKRNAAKQTHSTKVPTSKLGAQNAGRDTPVRAGGKPSAGSCSSWETLDSSSRNSGSQKQRHERQHQRRNGTRKGRSEQGVRTSQADEISALRGTIDGLKDLVSELKSERVETDFADFASERASASLNVQAKRKDVVKLPGDDGGKYCQPWQESQVPTTTVEGVVAKPMVLKTSIWGVFHKRSYNSSKLINRDHEGMKTDAIRDTHIDSRMFSYLRVNAQPRYKDREQAIIHLHKLKLKYYEVEKISVPDLSIHSVNVGDLTMARVADQMDTHFLLGEVQLYKNRSFTKALSNRFFRRTTAE